MPKQDENVVFSINVDVPGMSDDGDIVGHLRMVVHYDSEREGYIISLDFFKKDLIPRSDLEYTTKGMGTNDEMRGLSGVMILENVFLKERLDDFLLHKKPSEAFEKEVVENVSSDISDIFSRLVIDEAKKDNVLDDDKNPHRDFIIVGCMSVGAREKGKSVLQMTTDKATTAIYCDYIDKDNKKKVEERDSYTSQTDNEENLERETLSKDEEAGVQNASSPRYSLGSSEIQDTLDKVEDKGISKIIDDGKANEKFL